jgi:hypothetical protein
MVIAVLLCAGVILIKIIDQPTDIIGIQQPQDEL